MSRVYVSLGSNQDRERKIQQSVAELRALHRDIVLSPVYDSAAVGFEGADFLNLVAGFDTGQSLPAVIAGFRKIEDKLGRVRQRGKFVSRPIDLDILLYDDMTTEGHGIRIPRPEILENAFVLRPLQDIAPDEVHPEAGKTYAELWRQMAPHSPHLTWPIWLCTGALGWPWFCACAWFMVPIIWPAMAKPSPKSSISTTPST